MKTACIMNLPEICIIIIQSDINIARYGIDYVYRNNNDELFKTLYQLYGMFHDEYIRRAIFHNRHRVVQIVIDLLIEPLDLETIRNLAVYVGTNGLCPLFDKIISWDYRRPNNDILNIIMSHAIMFRHHSLQKRIMMQPNFTLLSSHIELAVDHGDGQTMNILNDKICTTHPEPAKLILIATRACNPTTLDRILPFSEHDQQYLFKAMTTSPAGFFPSIAQILSTANVLTKRLFPKHIRDAQSQLFANETYHILRPIMTIATKIPNVHALHHIQSFLYNEDNTRNIVAAPFGSRMKRIHHLIRHIFSLLFKTNRIHTWSVKTLSEMCNFTQQNLLHRQIEFGKKIKMDQQRNKKLKLLLC